MEPWEIAEHLTAATNPEVILKELKPNNPFWIGASYAIDPFVGRIYRPELFDPRRHERGISPNVFDQVARMIMSGELRGDRMGEAIEKLSQACTKEQWTLWYRKILEGELDLHIPLDLFNEYCPKPIQPPALSRPKPLSPARGASPTGDVPKAFFLQPAYEGRCFWLVDSKNTKTPDVRGYDDKIVRLRDPNIEKSLREIGEKQPVDIVVFGYLDEGFMVDDIVTREQFIRESSPFNLRQRLDAAEKLELPLVQRSEILTAFDGTFFNELYLIFEQRYKGAVLRDANAMYPFRSQSDWRLSARTWAKK